MRTARWWRALALTGILALVLAEAERGAKRFGRDPLDDGTQLHEGVPSGVRVATGHVGAHRQLESRGPLGVVLER